MDIKNKKRIKMDIKNKKRKQSGVSLLESLFALLLLGGGLLMYYRSYQEVQVNKNGEDYAKKSIAWANEWAYNQTLFDSVFTQEKNQGQAGPQYTNYDKFQSDLLKSQEKYLIQKVNQTAKYIPFQQTPCVLGYLNENNSGNNEINAIMFYVSKPKQKYNNQDKVSLNAMARYPNLLGVYSDKKSVGTISSDGFIGASGWTPNANLLKLIEDAAPRCVAGQDLSPNSIFVNIQMIPLYNDKQIAVSGLKKTIDQSGIVFNGTDKKGQNTEALYLPGRLFNNNSVKSNMEVKTDITLANSTSLKENIKLATENNGETLVAGGSDLDKTALLTSSIKPTGTVKNGSACRLSEVGKVMAEQAEVLSGEIQSRGLTVCTYNPTLCGNVGSYCYLPNKERIYKFNADPDIGLEDGTGFFKCPSYAPYLYSYEAGGGDKTKNISVFWNTGASGASLYTTDSAKMNVSGLLYNNQFNRFPKISANQSISNTRNFYVSTVNFIQVNNLKPMDSAFCLNNSNQPPLFCRNKSGKFGPISSPIITSFDFNNIQLGNREYGVYINTYSPAYSGGGTTTRAPIGVIRTSNTMNCQKSCEDLNNLGTSISDSIRWSQLSKYDFMYAQPTININNSKGCACVRKGGSSENPFGSQTISNPYIYGLAYIENSAQTSNQHLTSVTCSTVGSYNIK